MSYAPNRTDAVTGKTGNSESGTTLKTSFRSFSAPAPKRGKKTAKRAPQSRKSASDKFPIIVHSHLCWDWVWQRPQQFLSRLSQRHPILFVETIGPDPQLVTPVARFKSCAEFPNVTLLRLQFPSWRWNDGEYVDRTRRELVKEALEGPLAGRFDQPVQWFYDPMTVKAFAGKMGEIGTVYDCMDELSKFAQAHPELAKREKELLSHADVVFAGGRKLHEAKQRHNPNSHFYGCGVDCEHFGRALHAETMVPSDLKSASGPVLGYFGVVDERMDYELVGKLADANPGWSIVMIGPVLKVEESVLPRRANIHWLGGREYGALPAYCKGFDICLMPFALNEATEYINPTKALEYMATGRPIVSSAVPDVVSNFGSVVKIGTSHDEFISLCRDALTEPDRGAIERGLKMAANNTWECIVEKLEGHIHHALQNK